MGAAMVLVGLGSGLFSYLLHELVLSTSKFLGTNSAFTLRTYLYSSVLALTSYYLTKLVFKDTGGSGIPQVKLSLVVLKGKMPKRSSLGKFITTFLTLTSGLSFGKEGPMVTISAAWGHLISHLFKLNRYVTKLMVTAGATAGLAAAFNTPIAAVVFTIEEILGQLNSKYLGPVIFTSVVASVTSYELLGNKSTFVPLHYQLEHHWHLLLYFVLGFFMSFIGLVFKKLIIFFKDIKKKYFVKFEALYMLIVILLVGMASQYSSGLLGDGISVINQLLLGKSDAFFTSMLILFLLKLVLNTTSYSTGLSGGLFMPVLFLGAVGGALFSISLRELGIGAGIEPGVFALLGMTSLLVAVIRAPFTAFIMLFEMTRDYELILPLMISSITSYWISGLINPESVYESVAEYEGVHLPTQADNECLNEMVVEECMVKKVVAFSEELPIAEVINQINETDFGGYPVVRDRKLVGVVHRFDLKELYKDDPEAKVKDVTKYSVLSIYPDQSLLVALDKMKRFEIGRLPVVSRMVDKQLIGVITPEDIVNYLGLSKKVDTAIQEKNKVLKL